MNDKRSSVTSAALLVAGLLLSAALPASAQFKSQDGRALDANRRVGSAGGNDEANDRGGSRVTGNQIVTGNVTGGREFRGPIFYRDPSEFHGATGADVSDRFIRDSSGPTGASTVDTNGPQAFYGDRRITPPPPGYIPTAGANGGYVAVQAQDPSMIQSAWAGGRQGLGVNQSFKNTDTSLSQRFSELVLPGPSGDGTNSTDTFISASPLYGVRLFHTDNSTVDPTRPGTDQQGQDLSALDKLGLSDRSLSKMQEELANASNPRPRSQQDATDDPNAKNGNGADAAQGNGPRPIAQPIQTSVGGDASGNNGNNNTSGIQSGAFNGSPLAPGARQRILVPPAEQSELYRALEQMYQTQNANRAPNDLEVAHQLQSLQNVQRQAKEAADKAADANAAADPNAAKKPAAGGGAAGGPDGGAAGTATRQPTRVAPPARTAAVDPSGTDAKAPVQPVEPLNVDSLATGVKAKGLADLLKSAEDLMKQQKYTSAIQKYEFASRVAPNNALITLGRAQAELGASLYAQSETDLRRAIQSTPALLMGRYNLRTFIGEERMGFLVKDLKEISEKDPKQVRPLLLLTYIAYNSGNKEQAKDYLESALKLASADPVLLAMREHWGLKEKEADDKSTKDSSTPQAPVKTATPPAVKSATPALNK